MTSGRRSDVPTVALFPPAAVVGGTLAIDAVAADVSAALRRRGIPSLVLRGPALKLWLYGRALRWYDDVDLLVPPSEFDRAGKVLAGLGLVERFAQWSPVERPWHSSEWDGGPLGVPVDLHRTLSGVGAEPSKLWRVLAARARATRLPAGTVTVPDRAASALIVALHAAQHGRDEGKALGDLDRALLTLSRGEWEAAARLATELDAIPALAAGLRLRPAGSTLAGELGLRREIDPETALRVRRQVPTALGFAGLAAAPGARGKARVLTRKLVPTPAFMRRKFGFARRGRLGLAAAYAWRPVALALQAPRGLWAWRRAVIQARRTAVPRP